MTDAIAVADITKRFGATVALDKASFVVGEGEVHALLGENGAGKSTMVKLLSGLLQPDAGTITLFGRRASLRTPRDCHRLGIQTAFQEMTLIPDLTVAQNLLLPYEPRVFGQINRRRANQLAAEHLAALDLVDIDPGAEVRDLELPVRQKIEIAKALSRNPRILLLDEPTSALSGADVQWLGNQIERMSALGVTMVFISHRMQEVRRFCDSLTVLRNGKDVGTFKARDISDDEVIRLVIGRSLAATFPAKREPAEAAETVPALAVHDLRAGARLRHMSFELRPREVLGIAALQGMGQQELFLTLFGVEGATGGRVEVDGSEVVLAGPRDAIRARLGISLLPEDRKTEGLSLKQSGRDNVSLPIVDRFTHFGLIDTDAEERAVDAVLSRMDVHPRALFKPCSSFSGGNQQKIAIAKWILADSRIWLMFDPTRGVDVGTKHEIYVLIREFAEGGGAVLYYSTEVPELVNLCDRVIVMYRGTAVEELTGDALTEENIMRAALGGQTDASAPAREAVS
jgi:ribose transport system ATP-binding protein